MINKALFEAIIGFDIIEFEVVNIEGKPERIEYYPASLPRVRCIDWKPTLLSVNIYEFAHKNVKAWADQLGYWLHSHGRLSLINDSYVESGSAFISLNSDIPTDIFKVTLSTELNAIFAAAKYILDNCSKTIPVEDVITVKLPKDFVDSIFGTVENSTQIQNKIQSKAISLDKKYTTRNGKKVRVYSVEAAGNLPVHGSIYVDGEWIMKNWTINGLRNLNFTPNDLDLIEVL